MQTRSWWVLPALAAATAAQAPITFGELVEEAADLPRLARIPEHRYVLEQWSSFDRRSTGPESPFWYANSDGFGREPIPNVAAVLEEPGPDGAGRYLLGAVEGPGALVRTWTAGMDGSLRVQLDGETLWEGSAKRFLEARTTCLLEVAGVADPASHPARVFEQEDADYLPLPFARSLRIEWTGSVQKLHFYQIQVRRYGAGTGVRGFRLADLLELRPALAQAARSLTDPESGPATGEDLRDALALEPGGEQVLERAVAEGAAGEAIVRLRLAVAADDREAALRGIVLRIAFDGSQRPQVEAPVGDFFGAGPGVHPFSSLPVTVAPDGAMECRFVMPYARSCRIELRNLSPAAARIVCERTVAPFAFDDRALHFRARWRVDRDLRTEPCDLPFVLLRGQGRFVGCAVQIVNPSGIPTPGGNWWGEGDEKVFVDDAPLPTTFGTGSEDYFNYSWSRPALFAHPYCGQPLCSGPGTAGFVSNHRFQVLDDIPFEEFFAFTMELWAHRRLDGLEYGRIAYLYARPGALDDHRRIQPREVELPVLPVRAPVADGGARGATIVDAWALDPRVGGRELDTAPEPLATRHRVVAWRAEPGEVLALRVPIPAAGAFDVHLVAVHAPDGALLRARSGGESIDLRTPHARQLRSITLATPALPAGEATLELECERGGFVGLDYVWVKPRN